MLQNANVSSLAILSVDSGRDCFYIYESSDISKRHSILSEFDLNGLEVEIQTFVGICRKRNPLNIIKCEKQHHFSFT